MKKRIVALLFCIVLYLSFPLCTFATSVDTTHPSSLKIVYKDGETPCEGLKIQIYRIAHVSPTGTYTLCDSFAKYPVTLDAKSQAEWKTVASTLAGYAIADAISPTITSTTDDKGAVTFDSLLPGMYLTLSVTYQNDTHYLFFENILTALPYPNGDGTYNYELTAYPKCEKREPIPEDISYRVLKQWQDIGAENKRPANVEVAIYKDKALQETVRLSAKNNWTYSWTAPDDGSDWVAVERNIPKPYRVTTVKSGSTTIITNSYQVSATQPETGESASIWLYAFALFVSGGLLLILGLLTKRADR